MVETEGCGAHDHVIGALALHASGDVGRLAERQLLALCSSTHLTYHHETGMNAVRTPRPL
jgi:hypothetical protein